ncbi:hypothetical protein LEP1GSC013_4503 [Leptospira interrogans serovar Valbuzzi str. Duyster]|uniref:hypothetical protein n=1 Tax=Leptospira interrogans TaxID=173 RepID=UPI0002B9A130|nr:hypothetical protein [Leptospira interrogans]EMJ57185.1 hypothetical protein LEP1GSC013_4503 [Leptospira interrogans serovar Valbuzzi str. Duyster]ENO73524.1 hypothetical protein LEP1GSC012_1717 [Leptospira interrogans serovar Valbuzzi str. Valbuzzi]
MRPSNKDAVIVARVLLEVQNKMFRYISLVEAKQDFRTDLVKTSEIAKKLRSLSFQEFLILKIIIAR